MVLLFTGEAGLTYGYGYDGWRPDGLFDYTGEGQKGDITMDRGNAAVRDHKQNGKTLHLFKNTDSGVLYMGEATYLGHRETRGPDVNGNDRRLYVFELEVHTGETGQPATADIASSQKGPPTSVSLNELRRRAPEAGSESDSPKERRRKANTRSRAVRDYVLKRAGALCESCGCEAPFKRKDGSPYLEPHHIRRRADEGPDHPRWVAGICPTCHARIHYGADGAELNAELGVMIGRIGPSQ